MITSSALWDFHVVGGCRALAPLGAYRDIKGLGFGVQVPNKQVLGIWVVVSIV